MYDGRYGGQLWKIKFVINKRHGKGREERDYKSYQYSHNMKTLINFYVGTILDLQKSCRNTTERFFMSFICILHSHGKFVRTTKLALVQYC